MAAMERHTHPYICVLIVDLHSNTGGRSCRRLIVTKNLHLVEDECLVPDGVKRVADGYSLLGLVEEGHNGVRIYKEKIYEDLKHYFYLDPCVFQPFSRPRYIVCLTKITKIICINVQALHHLMCIFFNSLATKSLKLKLFFRKVAIVFNNNPTKLVISDPR